MEEWSLRSLLNPVMARLLIYGVNPNDVEYVLSVVEKHSLTNVRFLEKCWLDEWEKKAARYRSLAEEAVRKHNIISASRFFLFAAHCYYAVFLINLREQATKAEIYRQYRELYCKSVAHYDHPVERISIPLWPGLSLPAYLHHGIQHDAQRGEMSFTGRKPCVVIFAGLGSCKEEMHLLARPLAERGMTVLVPDMPGSGEALFEYQVKCRIGNLNAAFTRLVDYLLTRDDIEPSALGAYGLCMGGGYAYRAACLDSRYAFCATLFPLFITKVEAGRTPQWMQQGEWFNYQTGNATPGGFFEEMRLLEEGELKCPYFFVHGEHDNWMTLPAAMELFNRAAGEKEKLIITEQPAFSTDQVVTHTMPVGEQLHWVTHVVADWFMAQCAKKIAH